MLEVLRFPHLVLADVGHHHGVGAAGFLPQVVDHVRGVKVPAVGQVLDVAHRGIAFQAVDVTPPLTAVDRLEAGQQFAQDLPQIADEGHIHFDVLVDFRGIDLHLDLLGLGRVGLQVAGHAVVKAHAQGDQQVGILDRVVHPGFAVHAHHAEIQRVGGGKRPEAEQRQRDGNARALRQLANLLPWRRRGGCRARRGSPAASLPESV